MTRILQGPHNSGIYLQLWS